MKKLFTILLIMLGFVSVNAQTDITLAPTDSLNQTFFNNLAADGNYAVHLPAGAIYNTKYRLNLKSGTSIKFIGDTPGVKPILSLNGLNLSATQGTIRFENVDLTGYEYLAGVITATKYNYIFNQSVASTTQAIEFVNCLIHDFVNTPMRTQGAETILISNFVTNNCIVYNLGDTYYFVNNNVATSKIDNITISNSTFYNVARFILQNMLNTSSIVINNCTFNDVIAASRYLIDTNTFGPAIFKVENTILGATKAPGASGSKGIRSGTGLASVNLYTTSDWGTGGGSSLPVGSFTAYTGASTALFTNPSQGNFLIKDAAFAGATSAGDPRWYYVTPTKVKPALSVDGVVIDKQSINLSVAGNVDIYTITGKLVKSDEGVTVVPISSLTKGIYLAKISVGGQIVVQKFVVQ